ncbi:MAG: alpha/beta fold hydrolase [Candidatus Geothermincolia bacterium]
MAEVSEGDRYIEAGSGFPIVMMPGMEGSKEFWRYQVESLSDSYRAVACDLAVRKPALSSTIADYAGQTLEIMDSLGIEKAVIIGESMGGMITQEIATSHPERVAGVVLCNTMDRGRRGGFGFNMFTLATLVHQMAFLPFLTDAQRRRMFRWVGKHRGFILDPTPGNEKLIDYLFAFGLECGGPSYLDKMIAISKGRYGEKLRGIGVPALVVRGTEDRLVGAETILELVGRIPDAELALIDGGGHCCTHTMPEESTLVIRDWLSRKGFPA